MLYPKPYTSNPHLFDCVNVHIDELRLDNVETHVHVDDLHDGMQGTIVASWAGDWRAGWHALPL